MKTFSMQRWTVASFVLGSIGVAGSIAVSTGCSATDPSTIDESASNVTADASTTPTPSNPTTTTNPASDACAADLQSDNANCGSCGNKCGSGEMCSSGKCASECSTGQTQCKGSGGAETCVDTMSDNANCGSCGNACGQGLACTNGKCPALTVTGGTYSLPDSEDAGGCSANTGPGAGLTLLNERDASVDLEWVDYGCAEQSYGTAATGASIGVGTYANHVWRVRDDADGGLIGEFVLTAAGTYTVEVH